jgi:heptaprenyl diphosphate synthase
MSLRRYCVLAMMLSIAIVLSILESFIPVFIPGVKLGLANVIILILLYEFSAKEAFLVNILRIVLVGILRSTLLTPTFLMSLSGGILSFLVMYLFSKMKFFSIIGVSVIGAFTHSLGQVLAAIIIMSLSAVVYYLPFIGILSVITGVFTGIITKTYLARSITKRFI